MMKKLKFLALPLALIALLGFVACSSDNDDSGNNSSGTSGSDSGSSKSDSGSDSDTTTDSVSATYTFHSTVTSAGSTTINETEYKLVYFGDWPKTIKSSDVKVNLSESVTMGGNTYYLGSDNNYYAKCTENAYSSYCTYSDGTSVAQSSSSSTKYFKVEPIIWRVLTEDYNSTGKALLFAEDILTANVPYYGTESSRALNSKTIYANNYKYSNIRAYLNGTANQFVTDGGTATNCAVDWSGKGFLQSAFTSSAQSLIATTTVDNSGASTNPYNNSSLWNGYTFACDNTSDKIFLLSEREVTTTGYGFGSYKSYDTARCRNATDFAKANYAYQSTWLLRSPDYYGSYRERSVDSSGSANDTYYVILSAGGIVPALCVSLSE